MSHEITFANGKHEMAYVGEKPWHGLGQELQPDATIDEWLVAAGMNWRVLRSKVRYSTDRSSNGIMEWPDKHVLFRSDSKAPLGLVSDHFKVVQPYDVLEFFRDLVEVAGFKLNTAGTLRGGSRFWALASIGAEERIVGRDLVKGFIMLASAVDGTMETIGKNVAQRVVCANTWRIAMGESGAPVVKVSHRSHFDPKVVKQELGIAVDSFHKFINSARELARRGVSKEEARRFVATLVADAETAVHEVAENKHFVKILELFNGDGRGATLPGVKNTAWGLFNATTEYVDHYMPARSVDNRLNRAWFGIGDQMKSNALELAYALV